MDDHFRKKKNTYGSIDSSNVCMCEFTRRVLEKCSVRHVHNSVYTNESLTVQYHPNIFIFHVKTISIIFILVNGNSNYYFVCANQSLPMQKYYVYDENDLL